MEKRLDVRTIDLKSFIHSISEIENVLEIYLFGSRGFKTGCLSSDIDILIYYINSIDNNALQSIRNQEHALDLFKTHDKKHAESFCNGSYINDNNLIDTLHAKLLWSKDSGYNEELLNSYRQIEVLANIDFKMSTICTYSQEEIAFFQKYGKRAIFVIMPFRDECNQVFNIVSDVFTNHGYKVTKASDKEFKDDLWSNVQVYLDCCRAAVSIFHFDDKFEFNPNVAIETGYMLAKIMNKDVCFLKDKRLNKLPTDFLGKLYKEYDIDNLDELKTQLNNWINDHSL